MPARNETTPTTLVMLGAGGIVCVLLLGIAIHSLGNGPLAIDVWWHDLMLAWRTNAGLAVAYALDFLGGAAAMIAIGILIVVCFLIARRPWAALTVVIAMLASEAVTGLLKVTFARPRPEDSLANHAMTSFPSGHTTLAATVAVVLALLLRTTIVWALGAAWVAVMAWGRTYLDAHWLTDVVAGAVLGAAVALLVWVALESAQNAPRYRSDGGRSIFPLL